MENKEEKIYFQIEQKTYEEMISNQAVLSTLVRLIADEQDKNKHLSAQDTYYKIIPLLRKLIIEEERIRNEY